jgi:hypothetical protein
MRKLLLLSAIALLPWAAANADTIQGTYAFSITGYSGFPSPTQAYVMPDPFILDDSVGATTGYVPFFNLFPADCNACVGRVGREYFDFNLSFEDLATGASGSYDNTAVYQEYWGGDGSSGTVSMLWSDNFNGSDAISDITLSDSTILQVYLGGGVANWNAESPLGAPIQITVLSVPDETPPVDTPEPGTLAILGIGLLGLIAARRRQ